MKVDHWVLGQAHEIKWTREVEKIKTLPTLWWKCWSQSSPVICEQYFLCHKACSKLLGLHSRKLELWFYSKALRCTKKIRVAQNSHNFSYTIGWGQDHKKLCSIKSIYHKYFLTQLETVHLQGSVAKGLSVSDSCRLL